MQPSSGADFHQHAMAVPVEAPFRLAVIRIVVVIIAEEQTISIMEGEATVALSVKMAWAAKLMSSEAAPGEISAAEVAATSRETGTAVATAFVSEGRCGCCNRSSSQC